LTEAKIIAALAIIIAALGGMLYYGHVREAAGIAQEKVLWDQDIQNREVTFDAKMAELAKQLAQTEAMNESIQEQYNETLAQASASASLFAERLRNATIALSASNSTLSKVGGLLGSATASQADSAERLGQLLGLIADFHTECVKNDAQLDALVREVRPQT
jgi:hypothetical protein